VNRKILLTVLALALLMMFATAPSALASQNCWHQHKTPYTFGAISIGIPNTGTTSYSADGKTEYVRDAEGMAYDFGHPWVAPEEWGASIGTNSFRMNVDANSPDYLKGKGVDHLKTTYSTGYLELKGDLKMEGLGLYTYNGPTFTHMIPPYGPVTVSNGDVFFGILMTGKYEGYGNFVDGKVKAKETMTGVVVLDGLLTGASVVSGTGTSEVVGKPERGCVVKYAIVARSDPAVPGTTVEMNGIEFTSNVGDIGHTYRTPWGTGSASDIGSWSLDLTAYTGSGAGITKDVYCRGTLRGIITIQFNGIGYYTYHGPTFTDSGVKVKDGDTFFGLLMEGHGLKYGVSGALRGVTLVAHFTGVVPLGYIIGLPSALDDANIMSETACVMR
jgi:hypothetical protein